MTGRGRYSRIAPGVALWWAAAAAAWAQPERITGGIRASRQVAMAARLNPNARAENDQGPADPSVPIDYATLHLRPTGAHQAALEKLLVDQQDPGLLPEPNLQCEATVRNATGENTTFGWRGRRGAWMSEQTGGDGSDRFLSSPEPRGKLGAA